MGRRGGQNGGDGRRRRWPGWLAVLGLAVWIAGGDRDQAGALVQGDFDGSGGVGLADFFLLVDALGSADPVYDLDGDGRVWLQDVVAFIAGFPGRQSDGPAAVDSTRADPGVGKAVAGTDSATVDSVVVDTLAADPAGPPPTDAGGGRVPAGGDTALTVSADTDPEEDRAAAGGDISREPGAADSVVVDTLAGPPPADPGMGKAGGDSARVDSVR